MPRLRRARTAEDQEDTSEFAANGLKHPNHGSLGLTVPIQIGVDKEAYSRIF
jgi:hypothetical protein